MFGMQYGRNPKIDEVNSVNSLKHEWDALWYGEVWKDEINFTN